MGELFNSKPELNEVTTTFPIENGLCMWVKSALIPALRAGVQKYTYDLKTMTYTLL